MNSIKNPISDALSEKTEFISGLKQATKHFFENEELETLFQTNNRHIKAFRHENNMIIYILDKQDNKIIVNSHNIYEFNEKKSIKEIIYWQHKEQNGQVEKNMNMHTVIECNLKNAKNTTSEEKKPETEEEFETSLRQKMNEDNIDEDIESSIQEFMKYIKNAFSEKILSNESFFNIYFKEKNPFVCSTDVGTIQQYTQLLNQKGYLKEVYPDDFFTDLNTKATPKYQKMLADWTIGMKGMIKACEENKYNSYEQSFKFNDLDNHVWLKDNKLVVTSQNVGFYFHIKDENNFIIDKLQKEYQCVEKEIERIDKELEEGIINNVKDVVLKIENGQITQLNFSLMYCFELDMEFSVKAMKEEGIFKIDYPVDITSYQYQKDYYAHIFGFTEFEFLTSAMMTLGGGFDYDKKEGKFIYSGIKYISNLPEAPDTRNKTFKNFNYLYLNKISYLNADWLDGLKYVVEVFKKDKPTPLIFKGDNGEDALEQAIQYYETIISKLEKSKNKPSI